MKIVDYVFVFYVYFSLSRHFSIARGVKFAPGYILYVAEN